MPNLLDIRRRIRSVKNTQQITQAMKMVSAAKLRRAQAQALAARPYARQLHALLEGAASFLDPSELAGLRLEGEEWALGALLERRSSIERRLFVVITTDSGLVGAFNVNAIKAAAAAGASAAGARIAAVGRKGRDYFKRHDFALAGEYTGVAVKGVGVDHGVARRIARAAMRQFAAGEVDEVLLVGNEFQSVLRQRLAVHRLLPFDLPEGKGPARNYIFETPPAQLLGQLLPRALEAQVYRSLLESLAAEHAARMSAMEAATSNAGDLIDTLTLHMNRVRQAAITKEIIEVVSGASALG